MCQESCECLNTRQEKQKEVYTNILLDVLLLKEQVSLLEDIIKSASEAEEKDSQITLNPSTLKEMLLVKYLKTNYREQQRMSIEKAKLGLLGLLNLVNTVANSLNILELEQSITQMKANHKVMEN